MAQRCTEGPACTGIKRYPQTDDPRAAHLYDTLWVKRTEPVSADGIQQPGPGEPALQQIYPHTRPTVALKT